MPELPLNNPPPLDAESPTQRVHFVWEKEFSALRKEFEIEGNRAPNLFCELLPTDVDPGHPKRPGERAECAVVNPFADAAGKKTVWLWGAPQEIQRFLGLAQRGGIVLPERLFPFSPHQHLSGVPTFYCDYWVLWICFVLEKVKEERGFTEVNQSRIRLVMNPFSASVFAIDLSLPLAKTHDSDSTDKQVLRIPSIERGPAVFARAKLKTAGSPVAAVGGIPQYVTLDQIAAAVSRSKRTLEKLKTRSNNPLPSPEVEGGGGKPDEWDWSKIRPWLEAEYSRKLPEKYPSIR
jgi:hypothetical protein